MMSILPEAYLPKSAPLSVWRQSGWITLDRRDGIREGCLIEARGVDPRALPTLTTLPMPKRTAHPALAGKPLSLHLVDGVLYAVTEQDGEATLWREKDGAWQAYSLGNAYPSQARTVLSFTYYNFPDNPLNTTYNYPMVLILPDGYYLRPDEEEAKLYNLYMREGAMPYLSSACVYLSRLFGVGGGVAYASDHNCVTEWNFDTADSISASHAWYTTSHSAGAANAGDFTAIVAYSGLILAFKEQCCQMIAGSKNPFRIADLLSVGAADARTVAQVGPYLMFADRQQVYRFDGDDVREVGMPLHVEDFSGAVAASGGGLYYLYVPSCNRVFTYSSDTGAWGELYSFTTKPIVSMVGLGEKGCLFLDEAGEIYTTEDAEEICFSVETSSIVPDLPAPSRLLRLRLTLVATEGASLSLSCRFSDGRTLPLFTIEGDGRTQRRSVRIPGASDTAASLLFTGTGKISIKAIDLVTAETATDGT
ncbi:MAG: hypothetical protein IJ012_07950 [Clostridia bacterium]|nr:hypothetical protein [Clostridia bacterium]